MTLQEKQAAADSLLNSRLVLEPAATGGAGTFFDETRRHTGWPNCWWLHSADLDRHHRGGGSFSDRAPRVADRRLPDYLRTPRRCTVEKLAGQVKRSFTVSAADETCKHAIQDFWRDFKSPDRFSPEDDRLVLVTFRGADTLLKHFVGLLDCARVARDGAEFEHRLATKGFVLTKRSSIAASCGKSSATSRDSPPQRPTSGRFRAART